MYRVPALAFAIAVLAFAPAVNAEVSSAPRIAAAVAGDDATSASAPQAGASTPEGVGRTQPVADAKSGGDEKDRAAGSGSAKIEPPKPAPITLVADVDLTRQRMTVSVGGGVKYTWPISSGVRGFETPTGTFRPQWMARSWFSRKYDDAPMPNSVFFKDGAAIHGSRSVHMLGSPASHGCVRLSTANSATFYDLVQKHGLAGTRIKVHGTPVFKEIPIARRERAPVGIRVAGDWAAAGGPPRTTVPMAVGRYYRAPALPPAHVSAAPAGGYVFPGDRPVYVRPQYYSRYVVPGFVRD